VSKFGKVIYIVFGVFSAYVLFRYAGFLVADYLETGNIRIVIGFVTFAVGFVIVVLKLRKIKKGMDEDSKDVGEGK